jgi:uncharacterized protein YdhG (YjbR/CyaY superfamily)
MPKRPTTVASYIASTPKATQSRLRGMRRAIRTAAPHAKESVSYGMPYYAHNGRLAYFRLWKKHIGLYVPPPIVQEHARELKKYKTEKATIQFPLDETLPLTLIKKLIRARTKYNNARRK